MIMIGPIPGSRLTRRLGVATALLVGLQLSMLAGIAAAQDNPCKSEDPANFDEELRRDCGGDKPYMPNHWGSDVNPPNESGGLPQGSGTDSGGYSSLADWFQNLSAADRTRFMQWAGQQGLQDANTLSEDDFAVLLKLMDAQLQREGASDADRQKMVRIIADEFGSGAQDSDESFWAGTGDPFDDSDLQAEDFGQPPATEDFGRPSDGEPASDLDFGN